VGFVTTNPKKLVLHFYDFSKIFYAIYKNQQGHFIISVTNLQAGPRKDFPLCNVTPGGRWPARRRNSGEAGSRGRAEVDAGWSRGVPGPVWGFGRGQGAAGDGARRRRPEPIAVARRPAKDEHARDDTRLRKPG
jgi:hypothetical protein